MGRRLLGAVYPFRLLCQEVWQVFFSLAFYHVNLNNHAAFLSVREGSGKKLLLKIEPIALKKIFERDNIVQEVK